MFVSVTQWVEGQSMNPNDDGFGRKLSTESGTHLIDFGIFHEVVTRLADIAGSQDQTLIHKDARSFK